MKCKKSNDKISIPFKQFWKTVRKNIGNLRELSKVIIKFCTIMSYTNSRTHSLTIKHKNMPGWHPVEYKTRHVSLPLLKIVHSLSHLHGVLQISGVNSNTIVRFLDHDFIMQCEISPIWGRFPLIYTFDTTKVHHISTSALFDLLT